MSEVRVRLFYAMIDKCNGSNTYTSRSYVRELVGIQAHVCECTRQNTRKWEICSESKGATRTSKFCTRMCYYRLRACERLLNYGRNYDLPSGNTAVWHALENINCTIYQG